MKVPTNVFHGRILQRTLEQISDIQVPQVEEELIEVFTDLSLDRDQQRFAEQIFENPAFSPSEIIKFFSQDRAQQHCVEQMIATISLTEEIKEVPTFTRDGDRQVPESRDRS